ncbi:MAG: hypothetical protein ACLTDS_12145 [Bianqueaceae bacterium]
MSENLLNSGCRGGLSILEHSRIDIGIASRRVVNLQASDSAEGGSTITQQVIKSGPDPDKTGRAKFGMVFGAASGIRFNAGIWP